MHGKLSFSTLLTEMKELPMTWENVWMLSIIQDIFCTQSGTSILLTVWKWSGESRYPGAFLPVLENFHHAFSPNLTDCPWVPEDGSV